MLFHILESEILEAQAQYDFTARSSREVSFRTGDSITLFSQVWYGYARPLYWWLVLFWQVSSDWWRGCVAGREGLIPDKYILLKIR